MKVIGIVSSETYLVEVSHSEIEKVLGKYYGKLNKLKVGDQINSAEAHDYAAQIESACREMRDAMTAFGRAQSTMLRFAEMVAEKEQPSPAENGGEHG